MKTGHGQLFRLFTAIAAGIAFGALAPAYGIQITNTFCELFAAFMRFFVPFIVLGLVTASIASIQRGAGRTLLLSLALAAISTVASGFLAFAAIHGTASFVTSGTTASSTFAHATTFMPLFTVNLPTALDVRTALLAAILFGLGTSAASAEHLRDTTIEFKRVILKLLNTIVVPALPLYVFSVVANLTASGQFVSLGGGCARIMLVAALTSIGLLALQYVAAGIISGRNPAKSIFTMLPAYLAGCGSCSSVATVPLTIRQTCENGVSDETAELVVPLCSSIHHVGGICNMIIFTAGAMLLSGDTPTLATFAKYILMVSAVSFASPGVPGGLVLACTSVAETTLGFTPDRYAIIIALYLAMDSLGTACNLSCDGALAMMVDGISRRKLFICRDPMRVPMPV